MGKLGPHAMQPLAFTRPGLGLQRRAAATAAAPSAAGAAAATAAGRNAARGGENGQEGPERDGKMVIYP